MSMSRLYTRRSPTAVAQRSLAERAYHQLRLELIECRLAPRQRLTEAAVAERLAIGKMPAREALRRLVIEGLVEVVPRHGYAVAPITLQDVRDLFELRIIVEPAAVERAAGQVDATEYARLKKLSEVGYSIGGRESVRRYCRANTEFHSRLAGLSGNRRIGDLVAKLLRDSERLINFILPAHPESELTVQVHGRLLAAVMEGNGALARRIEERHLRATQQMAVDAVLADTRLANTPLGV